MNFVDGNYDFVLAGSSIPIVSKQTGALGWVRFDEVEAKLPGLTKAV